MIPSRNSILVGKDKSGRDGSLEKRRAAAATATPQHLHARNLRSVGAMVEETGGRKWYTHYDHDSSFETLAVTRAQVQYGSPPPPYVLLHRTTRTPYHTPAPVASDRS